MHRDEGRTKLCESPQDQAFEIVVVLVLRQANG